MTNLFISRLALVKQNYYIKQFSHDLPIFLVKHTVFKTTFFYVFIYFLQVSSVCECYFLVGQAMMKTHDNQMRRKNSTLSISITKETH